MTTRFLPLAATILCLAIPVAGAAAPSQNEQLIRSVENELPRYVQNVDVRSLEASQVAALHLVLHSDGTHSDIRGQVLSILGGLDVLLFGRNLSFP